MIEVDGLTYRYPGARRDAVRSIGFTIGRAEVFGLLGPSGAGKSTTQKMLVGLLPGYGGSVRVFGRDVRAQGRGYYERIGVAFEVPGLYGKLTGRENLSFFGSLYAGPTEAPESLLARVGLEEAAHQRVSRYSRGMKMRLGLCRALLNSPEILFLDEPTAAQDPANARRIRALIAEKRASGATVFITTHDMTLAAEVCDRVAFMVDGAIALIASPRTLMVEHGRRVVRVEFRSGDDLTSRDYPLDGLAANEEFMTILRNGRIETMHTLDATLEDVFVEVTGRTLT